MRFGVMGWGRAAGAPRDRQSQGNQRGGRDGQNFSPSAEGGSCKERTMRGRVGGGAAAGCGGARCWQLHVGRRRRRQTRTLGWGLCLARVPHALKSALHTNARGRCLGGAAGSSWEQRDQCGDKSWGRGNRCEGRGVISSILPRRMGCRAARLLGRKGKRRGEKGGGGLPPSSALDGAQGQPEQLRPRRLLPAARAAAAPPADQQAPRPPAQQARPEQLQPLLPPLLAQSRWQRQRLPGARG